MASQAPVAQRGESRGEIIRAVIVVCRAASKRSDSGHMLLEAYRVSQARYPRRASGSGGVIRDQAVTNAYHNPAQGCACVLHGHALRERGAVKGQVSTTCWPWVLMT